MSRRQRFMFLGIAVVIAIIAIVVLADTSEDDTEPNPAAATATAEESSPEETPTATPTPTPKPQPPLLTADKVTELEFTEGETVRFRVRSDGPEEVHVHGYDISKDVEAGQTATISFKATITGIFEIEFEESGTQIAELKVEPG
jgi:hypothetical protein